jgi:hypothetical protein
LTSTDLGVTENEIAADLEPTEQLTSTVCVDNTIGLLDALRGGHKTELARLKVHESPGGRLVDEDAAP